MQYKQGETPVEPAKRNTAGGGSGSRTREKKQENTLKTEEPVK